jgi:hypothetical protein
MTFRCQSAKDLGFDKDKILKRQRSEDEQLKRTLSNNRLASKFTPEYIYTLRNKIAKSSGSTTIILTDSIYDQHSLNSNYIEMYFKNMDESARNNFRMLVLKDFKNRYRDAIKTLSDKLLK